MRVGERLKKAREDRQLDLNEISTRTHIPVKYLSAIESGQFSMLPPAKAHRLAYVREYAETLEMSPASFLYQFSQESNLENYKLVHPKKNIKIRYLNSLSYIIQSAIFAVFVIGFLGYLVWQVNGILRPPELTVYTPVDGYVSGRLTTLVQGETEKEVQITINGKEVMANDKGQFETPIDLSNGVNTITISAIKKHGKTTTITRNVVVKPGIEKVGMDSAKLPNY